MSTRGPWSQTGELINTGAALNNTQSQTPHPGLAYGTNLPLRSLRTPKWDKEGGGGCPAAQEQWLMGRGCPLESFDARHSVPGSKPWEDRGRAEWVPPA